MSRWTVARPGASALTRISMGRAGRGSAVVLAYHDVVDAPVATGWSVTVRQLKTHVRLLRRLGHRIVPLGDLTQLLRSGAAVDGLAAITFDDALAGVARHAAPALVELAAPACVMVVTASLGQRPSWWPESGPVMTRRDLGEWVDAGFDVASHGRTHVSLPGVGADRLRSEVRGSRAELEDLTGRLIHEFAFPFGHHDPRVRQEVVAEYAAAYTFLNGRLTGAEDRHRLPRLTMGPHQAGLRFAYHLGRGVGTWPEHQIDSVGDQMVAIT